MKKKIISRKGFTMIEMLACTITLLLLSGICSTGINFALKCYQQSVFESESQMLKSTLDLYINDILRYATDVQTEPAEGEGLKKVTGFTNNMYQIANGTICISSDDNKFFIKKNPENNTEYLLVSDNAYGEDLYIDKDSFTLEYNASTKCFSGTYTIKSTIVEDASKTCTFTCRTISE